MLSTRHNILTTQKFEHTDVPVHKHTSVTMKLNLTLWYQKMTSVNVQRDVEKTEHCQKLLAKNMQINGRPIEIPSLSHSTPHT